MLPLYHHQKADVEFLKQTPHALNLSDCGTGKTRTSIELIRARKHEGRTLIVCPKSIMQPAWGNDLDKFAPELSYSIATATNRAEAFNAQTDIVITNHDAVLWIQKCLDKHIPVLNGFTQLIIDESTAFKNISQRTKALIGFKNAFKYRLLLTGTVYTNSLTDIWRQALICDDGKRLGKSFFRFRDQVCTGRTLGNGITVWEDKPGMEPIIYELLKDITIRHKLEDCVEIPENATSTVHFELNKAHLKAYTEFENDALLQINDSKVIAINAAVLANKLLQIASGAVYDSDHNYQLLTTDRYELIKDLAEARAQVVIAFHWQHQKDQLLKLLPQAQFIDGAVNNKKRTELIAAFQNKEIPQILIHPKTGAHGITLTAGTATIWASPTYSSEDFTQLNHRIYRAGQKQKTETLLVTAKGTIEETVYKKLQGKLTNMHSIMSLFAA